MSAELPAGPDLGGSMEDATPLPDILARSRTGVVFGAGSLARLGPTSKEHGASHVLLVTDPGIIKAGHVDRAATSLRDVGVNVTVFDGVEANPTTVHVEAGVAIARDKQIDFLVGLGGGSSLDCATGINFLLTNGGKMADYWGVNKATEPMLPTIGIPTTAGTGSEAQSFALISDPVTHRKMACGDVKAVCCVAILDPELTLTQPPRVAAACGIDAVAHAVETAATTRQNQTSLAFSKEAWARLEPAFERAIQSPSDQEPRAAMLLGAHIAGAAIEHSMLGAAHACANPLTARFGIVHGEAVGLMLPFVIRFNGRNTANPYGLLCEDVERFACRVERMLEVAGLSRRLVDHNVSESVLPQLAEEAAQEWTAGFNPRPVGSTELLEIYRQAYA